MKQKYALLAVFFTLATVTSLQAQIFYSNGATVHVTTGGILHCNGGLTLDVNSNFTNDGATNVTKNSTLPLSGTMTINSGSSAGNGYYKVEQDWINNSVFIGGTSTVELYGNTQEFITSTNGTVTTFHNLLLTGTGTGNNRKKTLLLVNAMTDAAGGVLDIRNRELETQTNTFFVNDAATTAVSNLQVAGSEGFVSSQAPGVLSRATSGAGNFLFPVGSSVVTTRYRPVEISPNAGSTTDIYTVRFINHDPDNDGYNRAVNDGLYCNANDTFYHAILRPSGTDAADVKVYYIPAVDGAWTGVSHWRTSNNQWNDIAAVTTGTSGIFTTRARLAWGFANPGAPYVLTELSPAAPSIVCPTFCENTNGNLFVATGGTSYTWTVPGNGSISSGQGTDSLYVDWTTGMNAVSVVANGSTPGCTSLPVSCTPTVNPNPTAFFVTDTTNGGPWASTWSFIDGTTGNPVSWSWDFGNGQTSAAQNPTNTYTGAGTYTVTMVATDANGCMDSVQSIVSVLEGILIPNVFSPNGDGTNDEFYIPNSGLNEYKIEIFDRWGVKIFESEAPAIHWDGHSTSGGVCTDGTYYFVLHAVSDTHDYSTTGFITLIGSGKQ
ncbi:MAG: gliding motility-associated C-terminal domain-containing protein [Bacteroidia bacterium]